MTSGIANNPWVQLGAPSEASASPDNDEPSFPVVLTKDQVQATQNLVAGDDIAAPSTRPFSAVGAAGALTGTYYYTATFVTARGETAPWPGTATVVNPSSQQVNLSSIPLGPDGVIARRIYRTIAAPVDVKDYRFVVEIPNNTTTTYTDNALDAALGAPVNWGATNRGFFKDSSGDQFALFSDDSVAFGRGAFAANTGYASTAIGRDALKSNTTGNRNTAVGLYALESVTTASRNTSIGVHAGGGNISGFDNTCVGQAAGGSTTPMNNSNTIVGSQAMGNASGVNIGGGNTAIGYRALYTINTADNCIAIGSQTGQFANASRQLFIDTAGSARTTLAQTQDVGLIYGLGVTGTTPDSAGDQQLRFNAATRIGWGAAVVANLPAAVAALAGFRAWVGNASVAYTSANLGSTVAGGGVNVVPVFCNGTNWVIG